MARLSANPRSARTFLDTDLDVSTVKAVVTGETGRFLSSHAGTPAAPTPPTGVGRDRSCAVAVRRLRGGLPQLRTFLYSPVVAGTPPLSICTPRRQAFGGGVHVRGGSSRRSRPSTRSGDPVTTAKSIHTTTFGEGGWDR
jgi:hypothetical protein